MNCALWHCHTGTEKVLLKYLCKKIARMLEFMHLLLMSVYKIAKHFNQKGTSTYFCLQYVQCTLKSIIYNDRYHFGTSLFNKVISVFISLSCNLQEQDGWAHQKWLKEAEEDMKKGTDLSHSWLTFPGDHMGPEKYPIKPSREPPSKTMFSENTEAGKSEGANYKCWPNRKSLNWYCLRKSNGYIP